MIRLVFALPSIRVATLRHWRDEVEFSVDEHAVVGVEASKWARLLLKGHGGTLLTSAEPPSSAPQDIAGGLEDIAPLLWDARATAWSHAAKLEPMQRGPDVEPAARFETVNTWLVRVRQCADAMIRSPG